MDGWMIERRSAQKAFSRLVVFSSILAILHSSILPFFHHFNLPTFQ
jgi:hypothetical protein